MRAVVAGTIAVVCAAWATANVAASAGTEDDSDLQHRLDAVFETGITQQVAAARAADLIPHCEEEAQKGGSQRRASLWLALKELYLLRAKYALAMAHEQDSAWVVEQHVRSECNVPAEPGDSDQRLEAVGIRLDAREAAYRCAVERLPTSAGFWFSLAEAQFYRLRLSEAAQSFAAGLKIEPTSPFAFNAMAVQRRMGDMDGAIATVDSFHAAIIRAPDRGHLLGMESQAAIVRISAQLLAGQRSKAQEIWQQEAWLIGRGEFCLTFNETGAPVEVETCGSASSDGRSGSASDFPSPGVVQAWGKFAIGPLDALESKCDDAWKVLASAGNHRIVPQTLWVPEEDTVLKAMLQEGRWLLKMCSGFMSLSVRVLPADMPLGDDARDAIEAAPHVVQKLVTNPWLTADGHKADLRVHVVVASVARSRSCTATAGATLGTVRIWVGHRGMLRVAPLPYDATLREPGALVTSNPLHGRIRDPGADRLWASLSEATADRLRTRIRAAIGETVRAAGYGTIGDGLSISPSAARVYCTCEMVPSYSVYGFDVLLERRMGDSSEEELVPWILEASFSPDMRSSYAQSHSAAALQALRAVLATRSPGSNKESNSSTSTSPNAEVQQRKGGHAGDADAGGDATLALLQNHCVERLGCSEGNQRALKWCVQNLLDVEIEREHLEGLFRLYRPDSDDRAEERLAARIKEALS